MARAGQVLSDKELEEYQAYQRLGITLPDEFARVRIENTTINGPVYRFPTAEEEKAADDAAKASADAAKATDDLERKVRAEAAKRAGQEEPIPARPDGAPVVQKA